MDESRKLSQVVAQHVCRRLEQIQNAHTRDLWRARLPRAVYAEPGILYCNATAKRAVKTHRLSRRRSLDSKAAERPALVQIIFRLARGVFRINKYFPINLSSRRTCRVGIFLDGVLDSRGGIFQVFEIHCGMKFDLSVER